MCVISECFTFYIVPEMVGLHIYVFAPSWLYFVVGNCLDGMMSVIRGVGWNGCYLSYFGEEASEPYHFLQVLRSCDVLISVLSAIVA